jgi:hypothetical protein
VSFIREAAPARPFAVDVTPPPPSPQYLDRRDYVHHVDFDGGARHRAFAHHDAWVRHHSDLWHPVVAWLVDHDCAGAPLKAARANRDRAVAVAEAAVRQVADCRAGLGHAERALAETVAAATAARVPSGAPVLAAREALAAAELVAAAAASSAAAARSAYQRALGLIDWAEALAGAQNHRGDDAARAAAWLRAELDPPADAATDPLRWL